jgi:hypothetical protein
LRYYVSENHDPGPNSYETGPINLAPTPPLPKLPDGQQFPWICKLSGQCPSILGIHSLTRIISSPYEVMIATVRIGKNPQIAFNLKVFNVNKYDFSQNLAKVYLSNSDSCTRRSIFTLEG